MLFVCLSHSESVFLSCAVHFPLFLLLLSLLLLSPNLAFSLFLLLRRYEYARFLEENDMIEEAKGVYKDATMIRPHSLLLQFSFADFHERNKRVEDARALYESLLSNPRSNPAEVPLDRIPVAFPLSTSEKEQKVDGMYPKKEGQTVDPLVMIQFLRFAIRAQGVDESRKVCDYDSCYDHLKRYGTRWI